MLQIGNLPESFKDLWESFLSNQQAILLVVCAVLCLVITFSVAIAIFFKNNNSVHDTGAFAKHIAVAGLIVIVIVVFLAGIIALTTWLSQFINPFSFLGGDFL